jgi:LysR family transcriptional regulator, low CO2-responsive transcriptional regulator
MRNITLKQLRIVTAIARTGKIVNAAESVGVTASAVTLQLQQIEARVGLPLFERARHAMILTEAGQIWLDTAHRVEAVLLAAREGVDALSGLERGHVSVGVVSTAKYFAPAALGAFRRAHPDISISLFVGNRTEVLAKLAALECDLVIMGLPPEDMPVRSIIIGDHPHIIIAAPTHPLARRARLPMDALANEHFLMREPGSGTRMLMERIFADTNFTARPEMEMESNETIKQAVMAGLGIAFISGHTIAAEIESGRLAMLDVEGLPARRKWQIVRHKDKQQMPAAAAMWAFLEAEGGLFLPPILQHARSQMRKLTST